MIKNYNEIVTNLREIARDQLRMKMVSKRRTHIGLMNNDMSGLDEQEANYLKGIAIKQYAISKLDPADPEFKDKTAELEHDVVHYQNHIEDINASKTRLHEEIVAVEDKISAIQAGEVKVDAGDLETITNSLIQEVTSAAAQLLASSVTLTETK